MVTHKHKSNLTPPKVVKILSVNCAQVLHLNWNKYFGLCYFIFYVNLRNYYANVKNSSLS